jgi:hypothetical protein
MLSFFLLAVEREINKHIYCRFNIRTGSKIEYCTSTLITFKFECNFQRTEWVSSRNRASPVHILHSDIFFSSITRLDRNESRAQTFRYRRLLSKQNQNILNWSAYYWNKSRTFQSVPKLFKIESERFGVFLKFKNKTRTKPS